ncbi:transporter substrate-binding domain-containing protein [Bordetella genomosp. 4]|uniref:ABC transporter substrate-binding protein n=1 Tax=Bordetella genomosp. 4 TaxID=463044 RepID=A0A261U478_9BORD|nr:transporter substrate-binding domain-containing protein [Bordetella genomosp. 4]OZI56212.1 ABC transporter substrate-binding protein [Bordetella genomosp. 4]
MKALNVLSRAGRRALLAALWGPLIACLWVPILASAQTAAVASSQSEEAFSQARARGSLVVGVPYLAPEPAAGAKIRTPERLDTVMAQRLGQQLGLPVKVVQVDPARRLSALAAGDVDVLIADRVPDPGAAKHSGDARAASSAAMPSTLLDESRLNLATSDGQGTAAIPTGYAARPKAIIRSDTKLRQWKDVKGLTVCMSSAAFHAQALATQWGATVRPYRVPSDALVAVREGGCDVGLIDDVAWAPLMKFPEWKKFSSTLDEAGPRVERVWLVSTNDRVTRAWLTDAMQQWRREGIVQGMVDKWARDVAFDVYLDQEVPDCHG